MKFNLTTPCKDCPFRKDIAFSLRPERAEEISQALLNDQSFVCHKTVDYENENEDKDRSKESFCAGALIILEREGRPNYLPRIAVAFGELNFNDLDMEAPVYSSFQEFVQAMKKGR